jgi:hypothetical protein
LFAQVKQRLWGKQFESEDNINTAVTDSLHRLRKDNYRAATDHLPRRWEKCVDNAGDYILLTECNSDAGKKKVLQKFEKKICLQLRLHSNILQLL